MRRTLHAALLVFAAAAACRENTANAREVSKYPNDSSAGATRSDTGPMSATGGTMTAAATLRENMRKLWTDHVVWTRQYIVAAVDGDASAPAALKRLMKNQEDLGDAIKPYYGSGAGDSLTKLLKEHISIAGDLVTAAKAGNNAKVSDADKRWHTNASNIAAFLAAANPNWTKGDLESMLNEHLSLTTDEAKNRIGKKWDDDAPTFDKIYDQALKMADALADGIIKQHPTKA